MKKEVRKNHDDNIQIQNDRLFLRFIQFLLLHMHTNTLKQFKSVLFGVFSCHHYCLMLVWCEALKLCLRHYSPIPSIWRRQKMCLLQYLFLAMYMRLPLTLSKFSFFIILENSTTVLLFSFRLFITKLEFLK